MFICCYVLCLIYKIFFNLVYIRLGSGVYLKVGVY